MLFQKQLMMRKVLYALAPVFIFAFILYGWRLLAVGAVVFISGIAAEYIFTGKKNKKVSEAVLVTCALFTLSMPPYVPLWIASVGIIFGVIFAKNVYGGFGRNIFNPAIAGRVFIYVAFPGGMQRSFVLPWVPGTSWNPFYSVSPDMLTSATPMMDMRGGSLPDLTGLVTGFRSGAMGESAVILILLAGIYLSVTKTVKDMYYLDEMADLKEKLPNFHFIPSLSETIDTEQWDGERGIVTEVLDTYLKNRISRDGRLLEGFLCGSPGMINACEKVMISNGIDADRIYYDKFA